MKGTFPSRGYGASRESASTCHDEVLDLHQRRQEWKSMPIVTNGIDLTKNVVAIHGVDETGKAAVIKPQVSRDQLVNLIAQFLVVIYFPFPEAPPGKLPIVRG
jgi:hypothetical protein